MSPLCSMVGTGRGQSPVPVPARKTQSSGNLRKVPLPPHSCWNPDTSRRQLRKGTKPGFTGTVKQFLSNREQRPNQRRHAALGTGGWKGQEASATRTTQTEAVPRQSPLRRHRVTDPGNGWGGPGMSAPCPAPPTSSAGHHPPPATEEAGNTDILHFYILLVPRPSTIIAGSHDQKSTYLNRSS